MLVLNNAEIESLVGMDAALPAMEAAYRDLGEGAATNRPRSHTYFPVPSQTHPGFSYRFKSQEGGIRGAGVWALRITSDMAGFETLTGGVQRRRLLPAAPGGRYCGLVFLFDMETTELLAVLQDSYLQKLRVGATSAVGVKELAREESRTLGLFGSGWQAGAHLEAICLVREIRQVKVFSPTREHREAFAREMGARFRREVVAVSDPAEAVRGMDIVMAATAAVDAVFDGRLVEPGQHLGCIVASDKTQKRRELDDEAIARCDLVVVGSREHAVYDEQPDIYGVVEKGLLTWEQIHELGEVLTGKAPRRTDPRQVTLFNNNVGMGIQFAALGALVVQRARERGIGREVPSEWFLEETTP
ncbi:MAG: ornithine cyclodeaminase family protein [Deltaproteobacteria bacterium]|nr:ornithine cyclodeaminase family protein [Deltaproteobacteria bacterium]